MFQKLGWWIAHRPLWLVLAWVAVVAAGATWATLTTEQPPGDVGSFLPDGHPLNAANQMVRKAFPRLNAHSQIVLIAHRPGGLNSADYAYLGQIAEDAEANMGRQVLSPTVPFLRHRLVAPDGEAAIVVVNLPNNFVSAAAAYAVDQLAAIVDANPPPADLVTEITGTAGVGHDYGVATREALHRTTWVTIVAVLLILIIVYRSPVGAVVPLVSIGASVYIAFVLLDIMMHANFAISTMERIFSVVLIFGMGVDFALFWIARYREELQKTNDFAAAAVSATRFSGPAILVSAATTICGLTTMLVTDLTPTQSAGKVLSIVLTVALLAALTLAPALARLLGRALFWPMGYAGQTSLGQEKLWPHVANFVTRKPLPLLSVGVLVLGIPALWAATLEPRYDSLSELPPGSSSRRGFFLANEHFEKGQMYSNVVLLDYAGKSRSVMTLYDVSRQVAERVAAVPGVHDVYSLDAPLGRRQAGGVGELGATVAWLSTALGESETRPATGLQGAVEKLLATPKVKEMGEFIRTFYLSDDPRMLRFEVLIEYLPFSPEAMVLMDEVRRVIDETLAETATAGSSAPQVLMTGPTPYILAVREVSSRDQLVVKILASLVIGAIVFALIRDLPLTVFMLAATWLTYGATIAATEAFFVGFMGENGLDWKVRLIVFVIIVAVGQDYNIFLVSRIFQEPKELPDAEAARTAIVRTGSVISNCGLIMAATLGSLWVGQLGLLRQVGFALALGILLDTFFVRPLLLPSFFLATGRRRAGWEREAGSGN